VKYLNQIQITLRAARINIGYTRKQAAAIMDISHETLGTYEIDSTNIPRSILIKLEDTYGIPLENLFFGKESDQSINMRSQLKLVSC
jgi:transcriptional regulator with XRE-family HTH domain